MALATVFEPSPTSAPAREIDGNDGGSGLLVPPHAFGELIRFYRRRHQQIHNGQPWAQEDLAVAIGSDKSHVSRIERGHQLPSPQTLFRICDALGLSWPERSHLIALAGYVLAPPSPTVADAAKATEWTEPFFRSVPYPVALLDVEGRLWDVNDLHARTFYWYPNRNECVAELRGKRVIELLTDPEEQEWFRRIVVDFNAFARRQVVRFWYVLRDRQGSSEYQAILEQLLARDELRAIWLEISASLAQNAHCPFVDHQLLTLHHPQFGHHTVQVWHSALTFDDRFLVVHHVPADYASRRLFARLSASDRPCLRRVGLQASR